MVEVIITTQNFILIFASAFVSILAKTIVDYEIQKRGGLGKVKAWWVIGFMILVISVSIFIIFVLLDVANVTILSQKNITMVYR